MKNHPFPRMMGAAFCALTLVSMNAPVVAAQPGMYIEASAGITRPPDIGEDGVSADPGTDMTLGAAFGRSISDNTRVEAEVSYAKMAWDINGFDVTADGFGVATNLLYDIGVGSSPATFEVGIGFGWMFLDEACVEFEGARICTDAGDDDWNVQAILGGSYALSETGSVVVRYRMQNIGGFSSEERLHAFTVGYRHHF